jgi:hypothetical protein
VAAVPAEYGVTEMFMALRIAERFGAGTDPLARWDGLAPGTRLHLLAYERIRQHEEAREGGL